jgi:hypothetical protein
MTVEILGSFDSTRNPYVQYMSAVTCFDLCPSQGSIVLLDAQLTVQQAYTALVDTPERCGLVIDRTTCQLTSMLTHTDFLAMLYYALTMRQKNLQTKSLAWWLTTRDEEKKCRHLPTTSGVAFVHGKER